MSDSRPVPRPDPSAYSDRDDEYDEDPDYGNAPDGEMFTRTKLPPDAIPSQIRSTKDWIARLLKQIDPSIDLSNLDSVIQEQMEKRKIIPTFNPVDTQQNQLNQLTALLTQLQKEKKGGKKHKSKRYRKSRKQRKTKTKRRLRRSYKYK